MRLLLLPIVALLAPLVRGDIFAEYSITGTVDTSTIVGINSGDQWSGTLETFDNCTLCHYGAFDFTFALNAFGHHYVPGTADVPSLVTFDAVALSLEFIESDGPFFDLTDHSFLYSPTLRDTDHRVSGTVDIALTPEPDSILLFLTVIAVLGLIARKKEILASRPQKSSS